MKEVVGLILASGFATRFGSQKLLQSLGSDRSIVEQACRNLIKGIGRVVAVVRPDQQELTDLLRVQGAEIVLFLEPVFEWGATLEEGEKNALLNCSE
jgi:molybdopterin-guanine dinucleotide biosynthesis protein A